MHSPDDETLPTYTEADTSNGLDFSLEALIVQADISTPLTSYPATIPWTPIEELDPKIVSRQQIIDCFFDAVTNKKDELVAALIEKKLVTANTTSAKGLTPLLAAVHAGNVRMVQELMDFGAEVDVYSNDPNAVDNFYDETRHLRQRTPLQMAAATGNLTLVKLLIEVYGADDALIAPDGELALRLAVRGGHREVVDYLPIRRGGEWRRWKTKHNVLMRRAGKAGKAIYKFFEFFLWHLPRFFVWTVPKEVVVKPVVKGAKWAWKNKKRAGQWCKKQMKELPGRVKRGAEKVWGGVKKIPHGIKEVGKWLWEVIKAIPGAVKSMFEEMWKVIKKIPKAVSTLAMYVWLGIKATGSCIYSVFERLASFLHTVFSYIFNIFRGVTLQDVLNGITGLLKAIFIDFPKTLWGWILKFEDVSYKIMKTLFSSLGELLWYLGAGIVVVVTYVPKKALVILASIGKSIVEGFREILVWINPKR